MQFSTFFLLIGVGIFIFGLVLLYQLFKHKRQIDDSLAWPSTYGTVTGSETKSAWRSKGGRYYWAEITYKYSVLGMENTAMRKIRNFFGWKGPASASVNAYPIGSTFTVRYNPNKHQEHLLELDQVTRGEIIKVGLTFFEGIFFMVLSTLLRGL